MPEFDYLIKGGKVVDGSGAASFTGDIAIRDGLICEVGTHLSGTAGEVVDAEGAIVTPGFIDVHTHYDGQATWDDRMSPSFEHGVTTVVMGNCGVGFAPVRPGSHAQLIDIMEGVEDIPGTALYDGMPWGTWETYGQYVDILKSKQYSMDIASQMSHGALRAYVFGSEEAFRKEATADEVERMAGLVKQAMWDGAIGFSSNRMVAHMALSGQSVPGTYAADEEFIALTKAMGETGAGTIQLIPSDSVGSDALGAGADPHDIDHELTLMAQASRESGRPVTFSVVQYPQRPMAWRHTLDRANIENASGAQLYPQIVARPTGVLSGLSTYHVFQLRETYLKLASLPLAERVREMRRPEVKNAILTDRNIRDPRPGAVENFTADLFDRFVDLHYPLGSPVNYEPDPIHSAAYRARDKGVSAYDVVYDMLLEHDGKAILFLPFSNYVDENHDAIRDMLVEPATISGLSDAGAHVRVVCDASMPTYLLTHWVRDRHRGARIPLELAIHKLSGLNAAIYEMGDRGILAPGRRADINIINFDDLELCAPELRHDLPGNSGRIIQPSRGFRSTFVKGVMTRANDEDTGQRPGRFLAGNAARL